MIFLRGRDYSLLTQFNDLINNKRLIFLDFSENSNEKHTEVPLIFDQILNHFQRTVGVIFSPFFKKERENDQVSVTFHYH